MRLTNIVLLLLLQTLSYGQGLDRAKQAYQTGAYPAALQAAVNVYDEARHNGNQRQLADAGNLIGLVQLAQGHAKPALEYFQRAATANRRLGNRERLAANLLNISIALDEQGKTDSAIFYIKSSVNLSEALKLTNLIVMGHNHLGNYYARQKNWPAAEAEYQAVLEQNYSNWENSFAYTGLAKVRLAQQRYKAAAILADSGFNQASKADAKWDAVQALAIAHHAYAPFDPKTAYQRLLTYNQFNDSLLNNAKEKEINQILLKQKSAENDTLLQRQRIDQLLIIIICLAAVALTFGLLLIYRKVVHARRLNRDKDRLFSIIGHDLRSPLATLENTLQLFQSQTLSAEELSLFTGQLAGQVQASARMLDSLLVWANSQLSGFTTRPTQLNLSAKVEKILAVLRIAADQKALVIHHQKSIVPPITADADQVRIMIQNLLANAIKFTPQGGQIDISYEIDDRQVTLIIRDSGIGMSAKDLAAILSGNPVTRSTYGTANEKGIGLGLRLVKDFAEQNRIALSGESTPGEGTTFRLSFNLSRVRNAD